MYKYEIIFCLLTYRNYVDIKDFVDNLRSRVWNFTYKIVIANSYFCKESSDKISNIAKFNDCDFIEFENKGYGYGNNRAVEYAINKYQYEYLVVCNPDTIIEKFDYNNLKLYRYEIIAPKIVTKKKNSQNPMNFNYMPISERILFEGFKKSNKELFYLGISLIKLNKILNFLVKKIFNINQYKIHACHGSFIVFTRNSIEKLLPIFDEKIFLFGEEGDLARKAKYLDVDIVYDNRFEILHKEDGSMNLSEFNLNNILSESYIYYYEKWRQL